MIPSTGQASIEGLLQSAFEKTDSREYTGALNFLKNALTIEPQNIYLGALRRQLETMLELEHNEELSEDIRHEMIQPMPGLMECALRESQRMAHPHLATTRSSQAPPIPLSVKSEKAPPEGSDSGLSQTEAAAQKELEALKLLYFQRASKLVMQGNYEQALAEVQRVFTVDPGNTIAKEYSTRVEHLITQARQLAADPTRAKATSSRMVSATALPRPSTFDSRRATAWTDGFNSPAVSAPSPSQQRTSSSSQRLPESSLLHPAEAANSSLAAAGTEPRPATSGSRRLFAITGAAFLLLLVACAFIFWPKQSTSTEQQTALPVQTSSVAQNASSGNGSAVRQVEQQKPPLSLPQKAETPPPLTVLAKGTASLQQPKENAQPVPSKQKPAELLATTSAATPHTTIAPSKNEAAPTNEIAKNPALDPKPVAEQPAAQSPAFIPVEKEPRAVNLTNPVIPDYAWLSMKDAIVVAKVLIAKDGTPSDAQIVKSTSSIFDEPVLKAIKNSQFAPGEMQQGPVSAWLTITFRLKKPG